MTLGEGSAMLVLESLDAALARNAPILAEIVGFGMSADAHHITQPQSDGAALAMRKALKDAGASPDEVGYINAHGTGTQANDAVEAAAIHKVFGDRASQIPVSSTKSLHGHAMGATGALEAIATVIALRTGQLPFNAGVTTIDPAVNLDIILNQPAPPIPTALSLVELARLRWPQRCRRFQTLQSVVSCPSQVARPSDSGRVTTENVQLTTSHLALRATITSS